MLFCMRTTLDLEDELVRAAKLKAVETDSTLTRVIEDALRQSLARDAEPEEPFKLRWGTVKGRLLPGVDLTDRDSLYERMEGRA